MAGSTKMTERRDSLDSVKREEPEEVLLESSSNGVSRKDSEPTTSGEPVFENLVLRLGQVTRAYRVKGKLTEVRFSTRKMLTAAVGN